MSPIEQDKEIDLLVVEYNRLASEIRFYTQHYVVIFSISISTVCAASIYATSHKELWMVHVFVPLASVALGWLALAFAHDTTNAAFRIRNIESQICSLNDGRPIMRWDSTYAPLLLSHPMIDVVVEDEHKETRVRYPNPVLGAVVSCALLLFAIMLYSLVKAIGYILDVGGQFWAWVYLVVMIFIILVTICQLFRMYWGGGKLKLPRVGSA